ncbi:MAG: GyrI-like domain-containing protein [Gammaproteobacteria bacterium]
MSKLDFKKTLKTLYAAPKGRFERVDVPELRYVMVDGQGDPNTAPAYKCAIEWLYLVSYAMKFAARRELGKDYVVPPLEGLWWAENPADFVARRKDRWHWVMMIMVPDFVGQDIYAAVLAKTGAKLGEPPDTLRLETLTEGLSLQTLHIGSYDDEGAILAYLHDELMPTEKLVFNGRHHEIYLSDPRRTAPGKLKTILRQPVIAEVGR